MKIKLYVEWNEKRIVKLKRKLFTVNMMHGDRLRGPKKKKKNIRSRRYKKRGIFAGCGEREKKEACTFYITDMRINGSLNSGVGKISCQVKWD